MRLVEVTSRWEATDTLEIPDGPEGDALLERIEAGELDAIVEAGDVDTVGASLVDWSAKEVTQ